MTRAISRDGLKETRRRFPLFFSMMTREHRHERNDSSRLHVDRAIGGDLDHRRLDRAIAAGGASGSRSRPPAQCTNNLKQIGLGLHNYHTSINSFPLGNTTAYSYGYYSDWGAWSAHALLLGYMEGQPIYNACNFNLVVWFAGGWPANLTVTNTVINSFICPSDGQSPDTPNSRQWAGDTNNYFASMGTTTYQWSSSDGNSDGIFAWNAAYGVQAVTDGTSNTIAFSESLIATDTLWLPWRGGISAGSGGQNYLLDARSNLPALMADLQLCTQYWQSHQNPAGTNDKGFRWAMGGRGITMFNTIVTPNSLLYPWGGCRLDCGVRVCIRPILKRDE